MQPEEDGNDLVKVERLKVKFDEAVVRLLSALVIQLGFEIPGDESLLEQARASEKSGVLFLRIPYCTVYRSCR